MDLEELTKILHDMYFNSEEGETVAMIHLFGVRYADEIQQLGVAKTTIATEAGLEESYGTEISKGVKLSKYVVAKWTHNK